MKNVVYQCKGHTCVATSSQDLEDDYGGGVSLASATESQPRSASARRVKLDDGLTVVDLTLPLDTNTWLVLRAAPEKFGEVVQISLRREGATENLEGCELDWLVNGQRLEAPELKVAAEPPRSTLRGNVPRATIRELGMVEQFALKACEDRWTLKPQQLIEVRRFVELYEEELAWRGEAQEGGAARLLAPPGGWPKWKPLGETPPKVEGNALTGAELFKLLSPSVFQLEVHSKSGTAQGSAVAVSKSELLTNCHVLEGARRVIVRKGDDEFIGKITTADPASDRCVVAVKGQAFEPIKGVRDASALEVGEPVFTLGSPSGLELTLGDGILSGLREDKDHKFVQTTAPISPGSSGGGLFDARGNLVGITTLILTGRERLNQSLNFAIPADSFFQK